MPAKGVTLAKGDMRRTIELLESLGKTVTAVKVHLDGTFRVMTSEYVNKAAENPTNPFDEWKAKHDEGAP